MNSNSPLTADMIRDALHAVHDPVRGGSVVDTGRISGVVVRGAATGAQVGFLIGIAADEQAVMEVVRQQSEDCIAALPGVAKVTAVLTAQADPSAPLNAHQEAALQAGRPASSVRAKWNLTPLAGAGRVIAISSGKGGVGKSTLTVALAQALRVAGVRVGVLDADIYGPSVARMLGLSGQPATQDGRLIPAVGVAGIPALSMGQLLAEDEALVWRGPQLTKTLQQLTHGADWSGCYDGQGLELLLVDMPPGTGDVQLSLAQMLPLSGALVVTIPSRVSVADAAKCCVMWQKVNVPLLGVVENMSGLPQPDGTLLAVFGEGGGAALADRFSLPLLAQCPLQPALGQATDHGQPIPAALLATLTPILAPLSPHATQAA